MIEGVRQHKDLLGSEVTQGQVARPIAVLFLLGTCDMWCDFCINESSISPLDPERIPEVLDELTHRRITHLVLGGGEPFAWSGDVLALASAARARGLHVQLGTNGIQMPRAPQPGAPVDRYVLPLDAARASIHNGLRRGVKNHHALILERLAELRSTGHPVTVSTVISRPTVAALPELARLLADYAAGGGRLHAWHLYRFLPEGVGGSLHGNALAIDAETYASACESAANLLAATAPEVKVYRRPDMRQSKTVEFLWFEGRALRIGSELWTAERNEQSLA
ncbi:MAG: radical SAM protein [Planctomycetota bacterium]|nr:radical SAM protein [Planctomycetota bacterium]